MGNCVGNGLCFNGYVHCWVSSASAKTRPSLEAIPSTKFTTLLKSCWARDPRNRLDSKEIVMMLETLNNGWKPTVQPNM